LRTVLLGKVVADSAPPATSTVPLGEIAVMAAPMRIGETALLRVDHVGTRTVVVAVTTVPRAEVSVSV
jgi:hypothetical protein